MAFLKNEEFTKILTKKLECSLSDMADSRIITKNLVYVIGLSSKIASKETLLKREYFGQYGSISKVVVNSNKAYNQNNPKGPSFSAYVTYSKPYEASLAILSLDNIVVDDHLIRASFGTTKNAEQSDIISREDLNGNRNIFFEQQLYAIKIADLYNLEVKKKILQIKKVKTVFPSPENIYNKIIVKENDPANNPTKKKYYEDAYTPTNNKFFNTNLNHSLENLKIQKNTDTTSTSSKEDINHSCNEERVNVNTTTLNPSNTSNSTPNAIEKNINLENKIKKHILDKDQCLTPTNITPKTQTALINPHKLYEIKEKSRFNFAEIKSGSENIFVPDFIKKLINKKLASNILSRNIHHIEDVLYTDKNLESEFKMNNEWAQFVIDNKSKQIMEYYDKELVDDFNFINTKILRLINKHEIYK